MRIVKTRPFLSGHGKQGGAPRRRAPWGWPCACSRAARASRGWRGRARASQPTARPAWSRGGSPAPPLAAPPAWARPAHGPARHRARAAAPARAAPEPPRKPSGGGLCLLPVVCRRHTHLQDAARSGEHERPAPAKREVKRRPLPDTRRCARVPPEKHRAARTTRARAGGGRSRRRARRTSRAP